MDKRTMNVHCRVFSSIEDMPVLEVVLPRVPGCHTVAGSVPDDPGITDGLLSQPGGAGAELGVDAVECTDDSEPRWEIMLDDQGHPGRARGTGRPGEEDKGVEVRARSDIGCPSKGQGRARGRLFRCTRCPARCALLPSATPDVKFIYGLLPTAMSSTTLTRVYFTASIPDS